MIAMKTLYLIVPLAPLAGAIIAGLFGRAIGRAGAHWVTILSVAISFAASCAIFADVMAGHSFNGTVYTWLASGGTRFEIGFLIDRLTVLMMVVVTFVSLMVHVYTVGYMADDPGYQRFFSYISLFTFSMLMLVMSNNFLQLFFGWEAVGLVSYLLIGFWYTRPTAIYANLKAFLVNRVGDFGFLLGIALILSQFGTLDYASVFSQAPGAASGMTLICLLLFVGAMGKSAQFPLHVWLPDSMEGPTPISALIHAATMVTAGIFMVARMSPLFELSETARSVVMLIGAITALFMALVAVTQYDIKRVIAYSTLSQLGYMTVALGASAYSVGIFHLMTHAFFKAVLFLGAGSVIIALHHEQDMRRMGGLRKYMPITYLTVLIGALANAGLPPFAGFFSKDAILEAVQASHTPGAGFAYAALLLGVFFGGLYSFRLVFYAFHGEPRMDAHTREHLQRIALGGDAAARPAGDPVGRGRLVDRPDRVRGLFRLEHRAALPRGVPRRMELHAARHRRGAVLVRPRRRGPGRLPVPGAHRPAEEDRRRTGPDLRPGQPEIRLRRAVRLALRARRAAARHRPVEGRRRGGDRRRAGERLGARRRLGRFGGKAVPVRTGVSVRVHDADRGRAADLFLPAHVNNNKRHS